MILDTNAVWALAEGDSNLLEGVRGVAVFSLPVVVIGEFSFGIVRSRHRARYARWLEELIGASTVLSIDEETARHYAALRELLRTEGRPIPSNDVWIASLALQHDLAVLTRDEHFAALPGIRRVTW